LTLLILDNLEIFHISTIFETDTTSASDKYYAPDLIQYNPQIGNGIEGFKQFSGPFIEGLPDSYATVEHMTVEDNIIYL
jgi:predicted SnoaL-like aldol condensation-catalyzing enzyme